MLDDNGKVRDTSSCCSTSLGTGTVLRYFNFFSWYFIFFQTKPKFGDLINSSLV